MLGQFKIVSNDNLNRSDSKNYLHFVDDVCRCMNGGTCNRSATDYSCNCRIGFSGYKCESK
jgi:hypothetical protein